MALSLSPLAFHALPRLLKPHSPSHSGRPGTATCARLQVGADEVHCHALKIIASPANLQACRIQNRFLVNVVLAWVSQTLYPSFLGQLPQDGAVTERNIMAEAVRFELTNGCPLPVFKTGALSRSATPPRPTFSPSLLGQLRRGRQAVRERREDRLSKGAA